MAGYPNSEEEFELLYGDELELLREEEDINEPPIKSRKSLDFSVEKGTIKPLQTSQKNPSQNISNACDGNESVSTEHLSNSFETDFIPISPRSGDDTQNASTATDPSNTRKRTIQELFGDIDDILYENDGRHKRRKEKLSDFDMIEQILMLRKQAQENLKPSFGKTNTLSTAYRNKANLSYSIPRYSFVAVTRHDGERIYVRCHTDEFEKEEQNEVTKCCGFSGVMGEGFKQVWKDAQTYINEGIDRQEKENIPPDIDVQAIEKRPQENSCLWVDLYKPSKYIELLSDESTNRMLLKWLKLWDKVVFNRRPKMILLNTENDKFSKFRKELNLKLDEDGRPEYKAVLLCGPPGLGKTTLAHLVARHAGYNVVEINASDERTVEHFETAIKNSTQMQSVLEQERRPNCLVFDEIDGAPAPAIEYLVKRITAVPKPKKTAGKKDKVTVLKRPIICICNDAYVPALRPLRQVALRINFPHTSGIRLAERLQEIADRQAIRTDMGALRALCEKTENDVRSCLSVLQFFKARKKPVTLSEVMSASVGQKDIHKGLFDVWNEIFHIRRVKGSGESDSQMAASTAGVSDTSFRRRAERVLRAVYSFGDYERVTQGVYENFPLMPVRDSSLEGTTEALKWFCYGDLLNTKIYATQNFGLNQYVQYGFVVWHFVFGGFARPKLVYPSQGYEAKTNLARNEAIVAEVLMGMPPSARAFVNGASLKLDILPLLSRIIVPAFRPVSSQFFNEEEKKLVTQMACVMIDYGLTYVQERLPDGRYSFIIDPNIDEVVLYPDLRRTRFLTDGQKHIISLQVGVVKIGRVDISSKNSTKDVAETEKNKKSVVANVISEVKVKAKAQKTAVLKDIFGRIIEMKSTATRTTTRPDKDIWFRFKEGYSNAVRRPIKTSSLK